MLHDWGAPTVSTGIQVVIASVVVGHQALSREGKGCGKGPSVDAGERNVPHPQRCHRCLCCCQVVPHPGVLLSSRCLLLPRSAECGQEGIGVEQTPCLGMAGTVEAPVEEVLCRHTLLEAAVGNGDVPPLERPPWPHSGPGCAGPQSLAP
ncbi:MAG: hypothetical protein OXH24_00440, partial [Cyanobacteria bacterium MAG IRC3_bin_20]|nr:hypothetical protein [Cyanobacteria bacterium MAG IRC3_bin_20]